MMRRTVLLMVTTALTLIVAGGIALAATFTCTANPCDGTTDDDVITGTVGAETINGKAGNDQISAQDANDTLNGEDGDDTMHGELGDDQLNGDDGTDQLFGDNGRDRLNGGAGNDILNGGPETADVSSCSDYYASNCSDTYFFTPNWGNDTIIEGLGRGAIVATSATAAAMPNLTVNLISDPSRPEVSDGNGNTMNWENNDVYHATTGAGDDVISQRPQRANGMNGGAGNDTYKGYVPGVNGGDSISDQSGTADVLDLSSRSLADVAFTAPRFSTNIEYLKINFTLGTTMCDYSDNCNYTSISRYFDNTTPDVCASGPGPGLIETIKFADDPSVDFAQVRSLLGCPPLETAITSMTMEPWETSTKTTFRFSSNNGAATFECKLDGGTFGVCTSPKEYPGLIEGSTHTFEVRAVDAAGNTDPTPARRTWTVDTTLPMVSGTNPVNNATGIASTAVLDAFFSEQMDRSTVTTSTFTLTKQGSSTPVSARVEYLSNPKALLTPSSVLEANTTYTATVKGGPGGVKDLAGNPMAQDYSWSFTTAPPPSVPDTTITSGPSGTVDSTSASFGFSSSDNGAAFECKLDNGTFAGCTSPKPYTALSQGTHTFEVRATNSAGPDPTPASRTWTVAVPAPSCTKTGTANAETISGTSGDDIICAGGGNDTVKGLGGNDILRGEDGNDTLLGDVGNDTLDGGLGTDTASYSASLTAVNASLATNSSTGEGSDTFLGVENLLGSSKADTLTGSTTNNKLTGGGGTDLEQGGLGNDTVIGSGGADTLKGEDGADTVNSKDGVNGNDSLDGGAGTDTKVTDTTEKSIVGFP